MLQPKLLWRNLIMLLKGADQVAAIGKSGFIGDIIQIIVSEEQQIFHFAEPYKFNVLLTALPVMLVKQLGKVGVTHVVMMGKLFHIDIFL